MIKVRVSVFETNSSSCHAFVTGEGGIFKDFAEGRAVWVPYGLEDVPADLATKCVIAGIQDAVMEYCPEKRAAVFLKCSDIKDWAATLPEDHPYRSLATAVDDITLCGMLTDVHYRLQNIFNSEYDAYTWIPARDVGFTILEDNKFQLEHDWNTWD